MEIIEMWDSCVASALYSDYNLQGTRTFQFNLHSVAQSFRAKPHDQAYRKTVINLSPKNFAEGRPLYWNNRLLLSVTNT